MGCYTLPVVILVPDYTCLDLLPLFGCIVFSLIFLPTSYAHICLDSYHHLLTHIFIPCTYLSLLVYRIIYSVSFCWSPSWAVLSTPLGRFPPVTVSHSQASALLMPTGADLQFVPDICLPHPALKAKQRNHHLAGSMPGPSPKWWVVACQC